MGTSSFQQSALTFIEEEDDEDTAFKVLLVEIVVLGSHAVAAVERACAGSLAHSPSPSACKLDELGAAASEEDSTKASPLGVEPVGVNVVDVDATNVDACDDAEGFTGVVPTPSLSSGTLSSNHSTQTELAHPLSATPSAATLAEPKRSRSFCGKKTSRSSVLSNYSSTSRQSHQLGLANGADEDAQWYSCRCQVGQFKVTAHLWPIDSLSKELPRFPQSHSASSCYLLLVPVDSPALKTECLTLRQRLDEVRYLFRTLPNGPRLARANVYNTERTGSNVAGKEECSVMEEDIDRMGFIAERTDNIGRADFTDSASLYSTLVVRTTEWLIRNGAATGSPHSSERRTPH